MNDLFRVWFKGNEDACNMAEMLWTIAQEWDDLHDEGKCENHNALLSWLAFGKEYTPYFATHANILRPAFLTVYLQWRAANTLERGSESDVVKAYMLRAGLYTIWHLIAWIEGGDDWAAEVGPEIYRSYGETPAELWKEFH